MSRYRKMQRYPRNGWVAGVCSGVAQYFDWNVKILRVGVALVFFFSGFFPVGLIYCVLWYALDKSDDSIDAAQSPSGNVYSRDYESGRYETMPDIKTRFARMEDRLRSMEECVSSREFELRREFRKLEA